MSVSSMVREKHVMQTEREQGHVPGMRAMAGARASGYHAVMRLPLGSGGQAGRRQDRAVCTCWQAVDESVCIQLGCRPPGGRSRRARRSSVDPAQCVCSRDMPSASRDQTVRARPVATYDQTRMSVCVTGRWRSGQALAGRSAPAILRVVSRSRRANVAARCDWLRRARSGAPAPLAARSSSPWWRDASLGSACGHRPTATRRASAAGCSGSARARSCGAHRSVRGRDAADRCSRRSPPAVRPSSRRAPSADAPLVES